MEEFYDEEVPPPTVITEKKSLVGGESGGRKNKGRSKKKGASSAGRRQQQPSAYKIEGIEDAFTKDQLRKQKRRRRRQKRLERLGKLAVAVCIGGCITAIVMVSLIVAEVGKWANPPTLSPTMAPTLPPTTAPIATPAPITPSPTVKSDPTKSPTKSPTKRPTAAPTKAPTVSPAPTLSVKNEYVLEPKEDTYIHQDGPNMARSYGKEEILLVQNGITTNDDIPKTAALLTFDTSIVPSSDRLAKDGKTAILKLTHKPLALEDQDRPAGEITVRRIPSSPTLIVESINGMFDPKNFRDGTNKLVVGTTDTDVEVDISSLIWDDPFDNDIIFLMLENTGPVQEVGDEFYSRESDDKPQLILSNLIPN